MQSGLVITIGLILKQLNFTWKLIEYGQHEKKNRKYEIEYLFNFTMVIMNDIDKDFFSFFIVVEKVNAKADISSLLQINFYKLHHRIKILC